MESEKETLAISTPAVRHARPWCPPEGSRAAVVDVTDPHRNSAPQQWSDSSIRDPQRAEISKSTRHFSSLSAPLLPVRLIRRMHSQPQSSSHRWSGNHYRTKPVLSDQQYPCKIKKFCTIVENRNSGKLCCTVFSDRRPQRLRKSGS